MPDDIPSTSDFPYNNHELSYFLTTPTRNWSKESFREKVPNARLAGYYKTLEDIEANKYDDIPFAVSLHATCTLDNDIALGYFSRFLASEWSFLHFN